ncbi:MAG: hypothetical protein MR430_06640 [Lachnospiraceae bacterium]|nr:hypothetical protein [Lachnospiraceae bacterium]
MSVYKDGRLQLPRVTLAAMTSVRVRETVKALEYSRKGIDFGAVVLITHRRPLFLPGGIQYKHIARLKTIDDFNYNMIYKIHHYIDTDFMLLVHYDGFVVNPDMWRDEFLDYDYIGSPFPLPKDDFSYRDIHGNICRVGNSVSIRSKRLLEFPEKAGIPFEADHGFFNEDGFICCKNRHLFEAAGMRYAPLEVARYFGHESMIPEVAGIRPFVFHKWAGTNGEYPRFHR